MGKSNEASAAGSKTYNGDVVAVLIMSFGVTSISMKQYEMMSALDGNKTASGFQHDFRCILAKARELKARMDNGEQFEPVKPAVGSGNGRKRTAVSQEDLSSAPATPVKKTKVNAKTPTTSGRKKATKSKPEPEHKKSTKSPSPNERLQEEGLQGNDGLLGEDFQQNYIKSELTWDNEYI